METVMRFYIIGLFIFIGSASAEYNALVDSQIRSETVLASTYDPISRPLNVTTIKARLNVLAIDELDLKAQRFSLAGWITFEWYDWRLTWDPASYGDIQYIFTEESVVWKPGLVIDNSLDNLGVIQDDNLQLRIRYDGRVDWEVPLLLATHCQVDITYYPYDHQKCGIQLVTWVYTVDEINLEYNGDINLEDFQTNGEWAIYKTDQVANILRETKADGTVERFPQIEFDFYISRRTNFYNLNVMIPIILTSLLIVLVFIVPVASGEKLSYVLTVLLSLAVLMTMVSDQLPATSITTSILGIYLAVVLLLSAIAVLCTVIVLILFHREGKPEATSCSVLIARGLAKMMCWKPSGENFATDVAQIVPYGNRGSYRIYSRPKVPAVFDVTWVQVAEIYDKFFFVVFFVVTVAMNVGFVVTLIVGAKEEE